MGEWYIASQTPENFAMDESAGQYGTLNNGVITFPAQGIVLEPSEGEYAGKFFYANANGLQRIMLPGARVYDYSVALTKANPQTVSSKSAPPSPRTPESSAMRSSRAI